MNETPSKNSHDFSHWQEYLRIWVTPEHWLDSPIERHNAEDFAQRSIHSKTTKPFQVKDVNGRVVDSYKGTTGRQMLKAVHPTQSHPGLLNTQPKPCSSNTEPTGPSNTQDNPVHPAPGHPTANPIYQTHSPTRSIHHSQPGPSNTASPVHPTHSQPCPSNTQPIRFTQHTANSIQSRKVYTNIYGGTGDNNASKIGKGSQVFTPRLSKDFYWSTSVLS
jgi:hypothetical protein